MTLPSVSAVEVNEAHRLARESADSAIQHAIACGEMLARIKEQGKSDGTIPHGKWQAWVDANCEFSYQAAARYMKAAEQKSTGVEFSTLSRLYDSSQKQEPQHKKDPAPLPDDHCEVSDLENLSQKFGCIYADPPWVYGNQGTRAATGNHYSGMSVDEICAMPVAALAADVAHLHLWTTNAFLPDAFRVMAAWGFEYKSVFVWVKPQMGIGNYWRVSHEFMLLGTRGSCVFKDKSLMSWAALDRKRHSAKPDEIRRMIERASPGPYLELFARRLSPGWVSWGNQIERTMFEEVAGV
jgi:N6-adenosine-specific RNA methylase IME4